MKTYMLTGLLLLLVSFTGCAEPPPTGSSSGSSLDPIINSLTADPPVVQVGFFCTLTVDAEDPEGDQLNYFWSTAAGYITGSGPVVRYAALNCCVGSNTVTVTVKDGRGGSASQSVEVVVDGK